MLAKKSRLLAVLILVAALLLTVSVALAAQGVPGPPDDVGGGGGPPDNVGPPEGEMVQVTGWAYWGYVRTDPDTDEEVWAWRLSAAKNTPEDDDPILDFGPEGYCPDPCLTGELITGELNGTEPVTIKIGMNVIGTFRWSSDAETTILAQTDENSPARLSFGQEWIPLTPAAGTNYGRPPEGKWVKAWGRAGETDYAVLVWEIKYNFMPDNEFENWYWWRTSGQPWAMMWLLECATPGEEE